MKVLFTIASLHPETGGPAQSVPALCTALARSGVSVTLCAMDHGEGHKPPTRPEDCECTFVPLRSAAARRLQWAPEFAVQLRSLGRSRPAELIHDAGVWLPSNHATATVARELQLPRIVSPRGMLTSWSFRHQAWKKRVAWWLYQRRDLRAAALLHATSLEEAEDLRTLGFTQPIAVIPNGVLLPPPPVHTIRPDGTMRTALFISRIHPKKGLLNLVAAWRMVRPAGWRMLICGPDEGGHLAQVRQAVAEAGLTAAFEFLPPQYGVAKDKLLAEADLFVLPTFSENFGIAIAEALAAQIPVITSKGAPWAELETHHCGWWVDLGADPLARALAAATLLPSETLQEMGSRGRLLVEQNYSWPSIAAQMKTVYEWVLGGREKPACVVCKS